MTPAVVNRRMIPGFMVASFTPFAGYDVGRGPEVVVATDMRDAPGGPAKAQVTGER
jgi:hypothetical protein